MVNVISSAITNAPPPKIVADFLNRRNKVHYLKDHTKENLMQMFEMHPNERPRGKNKTTMPARNYCVITEHAGLMAMDGRLDTEVEIQEGEVAVDGRIDESAKRMVGSTTDVSANAPYNGTRWKFALDICIRAEIDRKDPEGKTKSYGFPIPPLDGVQASLS